MDQFKNVYKNWMREEVESTEVQSAKDAFLTKHFPTKPVTAAGAYWGAPAFRLALVGCMALLLVLKINPLDHATVSNPEVAQLLSVESQPAAVQEVPQTVLPSIATSNTASNPVQTQIKKLGSQMGATVAYQKSFPDAQITVVWVFPKGV